MKTRTRAMLSIDAAMFEEMKLLKARSGVPISRQLELSWQEIKKQKALGWWP